MGETGGARSAIELSVVVPAYNEAARLGTTVLRILEYLEAEDRPFEVIVVDDGSSDQTASIAERLQSGKVVVVRHPINRGKGAAVKTGILASRGSWVLLTDADLSTPVEELARLREHRAGASVVVGSRARPDSFVAPRQPLHREFLGKCHGCLLRILGLTRLRDTQCGFKLFDGKLIREVAPELETTGFAFDVELLALCERRGALVREVGVRWSHVPPSSVRIPRDSYRMLRDTLSLRRRLARR